MKINNRKRTPVRAPRTGWGRDLSKVTTTYSLKYSVFSNNKKMRSAKKQESTSHIQGEKVPNRKCSWEEPWFRLSIKRPQNSYYKYIHKLKAMIIE